MKSSSAKKLFDVAGIGCTAWDMLGILGKYPEPGDKAKLSRFEDLPGGQIQTALVAITRLGGKTAIVDTVGDDTYGEKIMESLIKEGVNRDYIVRRPGKTSLVSICIITEDSGERTLFFTIGTKGFLKPDEVPSDLILNSRVLLVDNHHGEGSVIASKLALKGKIPVVTDIERDNPYNDELFSLGNHHILPGDYLSHYTGEKEPEKGLEAIYKNYKPEIVIVTLGRQGSIAYRGKEFIRQPVYKVEPVVDTTGAGDVFHGAFSYGLALNYDLEKNLKFASMVAGLKCRGLGGQTAVPYRNEMEKLWSF